MSEEKHMDALIFIDTNIFLDFYRIRGDGVGLSVLGHIGESHDRIITGDQVEMEYKKNRQSVIIESLDQLKTPEWSRLTPPAFLADAQPAKIIAKNKKEITSQQKRLKRRIGAIVRNPSRNDPVYKELQRLFKNKGPYNLTRENKIRYQIRRLALKRFALGYPPRKDKATSIGDAINWEWILSCAKESGKDIIIVSRDTDYGITYNDEPVLNDWLFQEFKERTSRKRNIVLTTRLMQAFKMVSVTVTKQEEKEEKELIQSSSLASVGYNLATLTLEIEFRSGGIYQYYGVPQHIHEGLMNAGSKGSYFDQNIKKAGYPYTKIG